MSSYPHLPSQPGFSEKFVTVVANDIAIWYHYLISLYDYSIKIKTEVIDLQSAVQKLILDLQIEKTVFIQWKKENDKLIAHLTQLHPIPIAPPVSTDSSPLTPVTIPAAVPVLSKPQLSKR
ncbi:hypothetical protein OCU04_004937, partial [Sclerotinia nivalis]